MDFAMKCRWLIIPLVAFTANVNADFCTPDTGQAWYELTGELARKAKRCRYGIADGDIEACRPFVEKHKQTATISKYVIECYEDGRTGAGGFGFTARRKVEVNDNMAYIARAVEILREAADTLR